jgi:D-tyrosyl-tRNA(Tyr) deacylase
MRALIQRVINSSISIEGKEHAAIRQGLLVFVGIEDADNERDIDWLACKILRLRIFNDAQGIMNLSVIDIQGEILVVSQFTLHADTRKGNRPSYHQASKPDYAIPMYDAFVEKLKKEFKGTVKTGIFGADMKISLINDGPVTIFIDSKCRN